MFDMELDHGVFYFPEPGGGGFPYLRPQLLGDDNARQMRVQPCDDLVGDGSCPFRNLFSRDLFILIFPKKSDGIALFGFRTPEIDGRVVHGNLAG